MINLSLDDPEFFQKLNASRPDLFDQEKMAKNIEEERSYPMPTDRLQKTMRIEIENRLREWVDANNIHLDVNQKHALLYGVVPGIEAALSAMVNQIIGEGEVEDIDLSKSAKSRWGVRARNRVRAEQHQRAIALGFSIKEGK